MTIIHTTDGETIKLRGPAATRIVLKPGTLTEGVIRFAWEPEDRRATDLEIRMRIVSTPGAARLSAGLHTPIVRYHLETAHGDYVWREPPPVTPLGQFVDRQLNARGELIRVTARELQLLVGLQGWAAGTSIDGDTVSVEISFQPVTGMVQPLYPRTLFGAGSEPEAFPIEASEWRLSTSPQGTPIAAGTIALSGIDFFVFGGFAATDFATFRPIPPRAAFWTPVLVDVIAEYL